MKARARIYATASHGMRVQDIVMSEQQDLGGRTARINFPGCCGYLYISTSSEGTVWVGVHDAEGSTRVFAMGEVELTQVDEEDIDV